MPAVKGPGNAASAGVRGMRFRNRVFLAFSTATLLITALSTYLDYRVASRTALEEVRRELMCMAASTAAAIDGDAFASLRDPSQMSSPAYRRIQTHLRRVRAANSHMRVRYVYTMAPTGRPGVWRYVVDAERADSRTFTPLGKTETYAGDDVTPDSMVTDRPEADPQVRDYPGWGPLLSASAPIHDGAGRPVGTVGIDASAAAVAAAESQVRRAALFCLLLGLLLSASVSYLIACGVTHPISTLIAGTRTIAQGDFTYRVAIRNRDELGEMAEAFNRMTEGLRQRDLYKQQFERYVSRQIADKILGDPDRLFWEGERRCATILFSDIRGFTSTSEGMAPEAVVSRLNEYLSLMIDIIFEYDGTLDKFIGDAVMAVFGAPVSLGNDAERAVRTALAMQAAARTLSEKWLAEGKPPLSIGVGIHTGDVVVGNIGSERRLEYAAIGDTVNLASRLESLNKQYHTGILISESTYEALAPRLEAELIDTVAVRGRQQPVRIYSVLGMRGEYVPPASAPQSGR